MLSLRMLKLEARFNRKNLLVYLGVIAMAGVFLVFLNEESYHYAFFYLAGFTAFFTSTSFEQEILSKGTDYFSLLPMKSNERVRARYMLQALLAFCTLVIGILMGIGFDMKNHSGFGVSDILMIASVACFILLISGIQLPLFYKFSIARNAIVRVVLQMTPMFVIWVLGPRVFQWLSASAGDILSIVRWLQQNYYLACLLVMTVCLTAFLASCGVSCQIVRNKEY